MCHSHTPFLIATPFQLPLLGERVRGRGNGLALAKRQVNRILWYSHVKRHGEHHKNCYSIH
ncbi:Uncharacterised protein [Serratia fonticola]|nr:Uncharacterised protein [Serratia fonticola]